MIDFNNHFIFGGGCVKLQLSTNGTQFKFIYV